MEIEKFINQFYNRSFINSWSTRAVIEAAHVLPLIVIVLSDIP